MRFGRMQKCTQNSKRSRKNKKGRMPVMDNLISLLVYAEDQGIDVDWFPMSRASSLSIPLGDDRYGIAIDPAKLRSRQELVHKLAHELGHCQTGSFYNRYTDFDSRQRHENRADKWAVQKLIPAEALDDAIAAGCTEIWELAERFDVTEEFARKAVCYHVHGNLATELYF